MMPAGVRLQRRDVTLAQHCNLAGCNQIADRSIGSALACDVDTPADAPLAIDELSAVVGLHPCSEAESADSFDSTGFSWIVHGGCSDCAKGESGKISESRLDPTALNEPNTIPKSLSMANTAEQP